MKKLLNLTWILLIPVLTFANVNDHNPQINGKWISPEYGDVIKIQDWKKGIKVKDTYTHHWIKYRHDYKNKFKSDCGRTIQILDRYTIKFKNGKHAQPIVFKKVGHTPANYACGIGMHDDRNNYNTNSYYPHEDNNDYRNFKNKNIEGLYYNDRMRHEFIVLNDRNGIKTKIKGDNDWHFYSQTKQRGEVYIDRMGNQIKRVGKSNIEWVGANGKTQSLKKISDDPF